MDPEMNESNVFGSATHDAILFAPSVADGLAYVHDPPVQNAPNLTGQCERLRKRPQPRQ